MNIVFSLLIEIIKTLQNTVSVQANHLVFLAKWQKEYTDAMVRIPIYIQDPPRTSIPSTGDYLERKGFMGISLAELHQAAVDAQNGVPGAKAPPNVTIGDITIVWTDENSVRQLLNPALYPEGTPEGVSGIDLVVEQRWSGDGKYGGSDEKDADQRSAYNTLLQQYIENMRSRRQIIKDQAQQAETNMNQSNEALNQQSNLATAIIQQMSTILQAIFR